MCSTDDGSLVLGEYVDKSHDRSVTDLPGTEDHIIKQNGILARPDLLRKSQAEWMCCD